MASTFYNTPAYMEPVSSVTATPSVQLGAKRTEAGDDYIYCYNAGNSQISVGQGCILSAVTGYSVTVSSLTNTGGFFAVCKHATLTTATYGWLLTRGFAPINAVANSGIVSGAVIGAGADGLWTDVPVTLVAAVPQGYCVAATASGGIGTGYVKLYG